MDDTGQGNAYAFPLLVFPSRHFLQPLPRYGERFSFSVDCRAATNECRSFFAVREGGANKMHGESGE